MAMPFNIGQVDTLASAAVSSKGDTFEDGVPVYCGGKVAYPNNFLGIPAHDKHGVEQPISSDGNWHFDLYTAACMMPILKKDSADVLGDKDRDKLIDWWKHHADPHWNDWNNPGANGRAGDTVPAALWNDHKLSGMTIEQIDQTPLTAGGTLVDQLAQTGQAAQNTLIATQKILQFGTDPFNIVRILTMVVGVALISYGFRKAAA